MLLNTVLAESVKTAQTLGLLVVFIADLAGKEFVIDLVR